MKKLTLLLATVFAVGVLVVPGVTYAKDYCAVPLGSANPLKYEDVASNSQLCAAMNYLAQKGIMSQFGTYGTADGYTRAGDYTNRAQAIAVVLNAFDPESTKMNINNPIYGSQLGFTDTPPSEAQWWYVYALRGKQLGFINGYADGSFKGGNNVTRAEFAKMFLAASPSKNEVMIFDAYNHRYVFSDLVDNFNAWYGKYVAFIGYSAQMRTAFENSRCPGTKFCPSLPITTNEMALLMYNYHLWSGKDLGFKNNPTPTPVPTPSPTPSPLSVPVLSEPLNGTIYDTSLSNRTVNFQWKANGASYYKFRMRLYPSSNYFMDQTVYTNSYAYSFKGISDGGYNGVQYFWQVTAYDSNGKSLNSNENFFQFKANSIGLVNPVLKSPANGADFYNGNFNGNSNLMLSWYPVTGATKYDVLVYFGGNQSGTMIYSTSGTNYTIPYAALPTLNGPGYVLINWKVRAYDAYGNYKDSDQWQLKNNWQTAFVAPVLTSPTNGTAYDSTQTTRTINFQWTNTGASYYVLLIRQNPTSYHFINQTVYTNSASIHFSDDGIYDGAQYLWHVTAYDGNGKSIASPESSFQFKAGLTNLSKPVLKSPSSGANFYNGNFNGSNDLLLSWYPTTGAVKYDIYVSSSYNIPVFSTSATSYAVPSSVLPTSTNYLYWRVRAYDANGNYKDSDLWNIKMNW